MYLRQSGALVALMVLGLVGCERREKPSPTRTAPEVTSPESPKSPERVTTPAAAERAPVSGKNLEAVNAITAARCAREQRCGNIGADEKFASRAECTSKTRADWAEDLNNYECRGGIVAKELNECLEEIRNEDCKNPVDKLGRIMACRASDICKDL
jgi:hypothetical protein